MKPVAVALGFLVLYLVLEETARLTGSTYGQAGLVVAAATILAALAVEWVVSRLSPAAAATALGLGPPGRAALAVSVGLTALLLLVFPAYALATGTTLTLRADWYLLLPGLFAQGGVAEEVVFRGYLYRHFRSRHSFWRAAGLAAIPFTLVHLGLFAALSPILAAASLVVALFLTFPLSWLFEGSGNSIWPGAILHCCIQGAIKLVVVPEAGQIPLALCWMALGTALPWTVFILSRPRSGIGAPGR